MVEEIKKKKNRDHTNSTLYNFKHFYPIMSKFIQESRIPVKWQNITQHLGLASVGVEKIKKKKNRDHTNSTPLHNFKHFCPIMSKFVCLFAQSYNKS